MIAWKGFFEMKENADGESIPGTIRNLPAVLRSAAILAAHVVLLIGTSIVVFKKKDVLS
jgi:hypothetical protein